MSTKQLVAQFMAKGCFAYFYVDGGASLGGSVVKSRPAMQETICYAGK